MIASARMVAWSPSLAAGWQRLLLRVAARAEVPLQAMDAADPTPLDDSLLARFEAVRPADFRIFLDRRRSAEAAGYPKLA